MPLYKVTIHATGIRLQNEDGGPDIIGFYRVQKVWATSPSHAEQRALAKIDHDWRVGSRANAGQVPAMTVERVTEVGILQYLRHKNGGHVFYPEETDA